MGTREKGEKILDRLSKAYDSYLKGNASEEENAWVEKASEIIGKGPLRVSDDEVETVGQRTLKTLMEKHISKQKPLATTPHMGAMYLWRYGSVAAGILLAVGLFAYLLYPHATQVAAPSSMAIVGKPRTVLSSGIHELRRETLPDGSVVYLNYASELAYVAHEFNKQKREVWLIEGEAFFEVTKNPEKPFVVHHGHLQTVVKGTSFNIKAYALLGTSVVSVRTGKVTVSDRQRELGLLTANEQLSYTTDNRVVSISGIDGEDAASWREGRMVLNDAGAEELQLRIMQCFGVKVVIRSNALDSLRFNSSFGKGTRLEDVMDRLCGIYDIHYEMDTGMVIIYK
ncbi:MAG: FecR domain-containing protein [Breznakibacter sp.]